MSSRASCPGNACRTPLVDRGDILARSVAESVDHRMPRTCPGNRVRIPCGPAQPHPGTVTPRQSGADWRVWSRRAYLIGVRIRRSCSGLPHCRSLHRTQTGYARYASADIDDTFPAVAAAAFRHASGPAGHPTAKIIRTLPDRKDHSATPARCASADSSCPESAPPRPAISASRTLSADSAPPQISGSQTRLQTSGERLYSAFAAASDPRRREPQSNTGPSGGIGRRARFRT